MSTASLIGGLCWGWVVWAAGADDPGEAGQKVCAQEACIFTSAATIHARVGDGGGTGRLWADAHEQNALGEHPWCCSAETIVGGPRPH